jgi:glyoxylase-like metal-dependent hydrolase (beta-lactamase superfamily II)
MTRKFAASMFVAIAAAALAACAKKEEAPTPAAAPEPVPAAQTAPPEPPKPESFKEFKIGELDAFSLRDGTLEFPNDHKVFGIGKSDDEVNAVLTAAGLPTDKLQLGLDPLLVKTADKVLLFDTGANGVFGPTTGTLQASLKDANIDPASVTDIFISHVHGDHVGGLINNADGSLAFPNATIHISKAEWKFLQEMKQDLANQIGLANRDKLVAAMKPAVDAFKPGAELLKGVVTAVDIKGHTPGHSGYKITSGAESLLYVGDSVHHFVISVQKPGWPMGFDADPKVGAKSRADLIAKAAAEGQRIYAVHFPFPSVGKFMKDGDSYKWVGE